MWSLGRHGRALCGVSDARELARWLRIVSANRLINLGPDWKNTGKGGSTFGGSEFCADASALAEGLDVLTMKATTSDACPLFVELAAGLASVSLTLQGGAKARPPVSRMGNKRGYAAAILWACGLRQGQGARRYLWCEPDPGCSALLRAYGQPEVLREAAAIIRGWAKEDPRELWERLKAEGPIRSGETGALSRFAVLQAHKDRSGGFNAQHVGPPGDRRPADITLNATRMSTAPTFPAITVHPDAREVDPWHFAYCVTEAKHGDPLPPGSVVVIDPPYVGTTGYGHDLPREAVVEMARTWKAAGALVCICEQEPLPALMAEGWHALDITSTRKGQKRTFSKQQAEWLTMSEPPKWTPAEQLGLFQ